MTGEPSEGDGPVSPDAVFVDADGRLLESWAPGANPFHGVDKVAVIQYSVGVGLSAAGDPLAFLQVRTPDDPDVASGVMLVMARALAERLVGDLAAVLAVDDAR